MDIEALRQKLMELSKEELVAELIRLKTKKEEPPQRKENPLLPTALY